MIAQSVQMDFNSCSGTNASYGNGWMRASEAAEQCRASELVNEGLSGRTRRRRQISEAEQAHDQMIQENSNFLQFLAFAYRFTLSFLSSNAMYLVQLCPLQVGRYLLPSRSAIDTAWSSFLCWYPLPFLAIDLQVRLAEDDRRGEWNKSNSKHIK